jgi:hypothetical protein
MLRRGVFVYHNSYSCRSISRLGCNWIIDLFARFGASFLGGENRPSKEKPPPMKLHQPAVASSQNKVCHEEDLPFRLPADAHSSRRRRALLLRPSHQPSRPKVPEEAGIERADMIVVAGGAKTLASPRNDFDRTSFSNRSACRFACTRQSACS